MLSLRFFRAIPLVIMLLAWGAAFSFAAAKKTAAKKTSAKKSTGKKTAAKAAPTRSSKSKTAPKSASARKAAPAKSASKGGSKSKKTTVARRSYQSAPTPERYKEIQGALAQRGYLKSEPNGAWGNDSVEALKKFQEDQKLTPTGKLDSVSIINLGLGPKRSALLREPKPADPQKP
jgi:peptidoglycan hydrolase-like protein with peptidoglycan-binding domain